MSEREQVLVVLDDRGLSRVPEVVAELEAAGFEVERVLDAVGVITGSAPRNGVLALTSVDGVAGVEPVTGFQLPDPGSDVQ